MASGGGVVPQLHAFERQSVSREGVAGFLGDELLEHFAARLLCLVGHGIERAHYSGRRPAEPREDNKCVNSGGACPRKIGADGFRGLEALLDAFPDGRSLEVIPCEIQPRNRALRLRESPRRCGRAPGCIAAAPSDASTRRIVIGGPVIPRTRAFSPSTIAAISSSVFSTISGSVAPPTKLVTTIVPVGRRARK